MISGLLTWYPSLDSTDIGTFVPISGQIPDIRPDISNLPFLDSTDIGKSPILCKKKHDITRDVGEQYQDIGISCPEDTNIIPDIFQCRDIQISCIFRSQGRSAPPAPPRPDCGAAPRRLHWPLALPTLYSTPGLSVLQRDNPDTLAS
jgi:hypothetical protein